MGFGFTTMTRGNEAEVHAGVVPVVVAVRLREAFWDPLFDASFQVMDTGLAAGLEIMASSAGVTCHE